ncbi:hypothetical protein QQS21_004219 [Conoideocrella luteorostrata]|uniref:Zn(2)-C6 fungal-type domain-containing protein n=1 Tax=Conoideocrella luteorostrata TaxID=1105319 RepID=A0AAJ0CS10_9HYPO|nr:hypothetical protein QQS21_004219 [Conoideocrella luteorostrata]
MSGPWSPNFGVIIDSSTRRSACDQCHAQKLRCTRPNECHSCERCHRLKRSCVWSSPLRSGRPPKSKRLAADNTADAADTTADAADAITDTMKPQYGGDLPAMLVGDDTLDAASVAAATTTSAVTTAADSAPVATTAETPSFIPDWSFSDILGIPSLPSPQGDTLFQASCSLVHHPGVVTEQPPAPLAPEPFTENHSHDAAHSLSEINMALLRLNNSLRAEPWASMFESPSTVVALLTSCDRQADKIVSEYPLADIFEKTQAFTNLAKLTTATSAPIVTGIQSSSTATDSFRGSPYSGSSLSSSSWSCHDTRRHMGRNASFATLNNPWTQLRPRQPVKTSRTSTNLPSALVLATCYAHILNIYLTVFTHMSYFQQARTIMADSIGVDYHAKINPVIPPLQFGGFQPTHYGALQILVVVQITSFLLDEVERTLGIDEWERHVTTPPREANRDYSSQPRPTKRWYGFDSDDFSSQGFSTQPMPLLEKTVLTWEMIEMVVREDHDEAKPGGRLGRIGTLRRMIKKIKQTTGHC